ncbi:MAG: HD domain-containing protein [bacterium]|nr:HD domain-containing protein [bacterium]
METNPVFEHFLDRSLAHVIRFNSRPQHFPESVAEHSFYVAYFSSLLISFLKEAGEEIDEVRALKMALIHDMEESFSGDILTPFKHFNEEIVQAIDKVNQQSIHLVFENLPPTLRADYIALWTENGEHQTKEAQIVKTADKISLLAKCREEVRAGNDYFRRIYDRDLEKLRELEYPWWGKIRTEILG